jgi:hypothetical protein
VAFASRQGIIKIPKRTRPPKPIAPTAAATGPTTQ